MKRKLHFSFMHVIAGSLQRNYYTTKENLKLCQNLAFLSANMKRLWYFQLRTGSYKYSCHKLIRF